MFAKNIFGDGSFEKKKLERFFSKRKGVKE